MVLATALPDSMPAAEISAVYRLRWQTKLAFKRLKSVLHIDRLPTRTATGSLAWLYAHLIVLLLTEDITHDVLAFPPEPLAAAGRCSWWRVFKRAADAVRGGLIALPLQALGGAHARLHARLADPKRTRKRQMFSLVSAF